MMGERDVIFLPGLEIPVHLGVPERERAAAQVVAADVRLEVSGRFHEMRDALENTVDYEGVARRLRALAAERPRRLLETLAAEMAALLLALGGVAAVE